MSSSESEQRYWVTESHESLPVKVSQEGAAAVPPETIGDVFKKTVAAHGSKGALYFQAGGSDFSSWSWNEYYTQCRAFAKSLISLGVAPHRCINIIGFNSKEWFTANMGAILAGGIPAGIYTSNLPEACHYISEHSEAEVVVVEGAEQLAKYQEIGGRLPHLKALVVYGGAVPDGAKASCPIYSFEDFQALGKGVADSALDERMQSQKPEECCSLIYTSGTTGPPKAVMISHDNIIFTVSCCWGLEHSLFKMFNSSDRCVSYLPLSHIAAQVLDMHGPMKIGASVYFAQPDALRGSLVTTLKAARPTIFFGVPRVWEKIYEKMMTVGKSTKGLKKSIATWAKKKGTEHSRMLQYGDKGGHPSWYWLANMLVFQKVKATLGLDAAKCCFTAAAPISKEVLDYFASLDLPIYEIYGQSENTGPHTLNTPEGWKIGTVGRAMPGTECKIDPETGEFCFRGRHVFMGYLKSPDQTAAAIDKEGWLHSGDVVSLDADGFYSITGRIKELIITAGGENIPPVLIEDTFKKVMPYLRNCMVIGDKRKFLSIILALQVKVDLDSGVPSNELADEAMDHSKRIGSTATTTQEAAVCPKWKESLDKALKEANGHSTSKAQIVQKYSIIPTDFSEKGGELTPTLKLKRKPTLEKYAEMIEAMYA